MNNFIKLAINVDKLEDFWIQKIVFKKDQMHTDDLDARQYVKVKPIIGEHVDVYLADWTPQQLLDDLLSKIENPKRIYILVGEDDLMGMMATDSLESYYVI